ncbi:MAG: polyphosphate:AMP phosphotransferase [Alphaproteobacteria bacterium]|nr:polyphosphate:AMP phosphotransferase [Alphaproteobacteria bacterium]
MFAAAENAGAVSKADYKRRATVLREALLAVQYDLLRDKGFAPLILIAGVDGAGKGETVNLLNEWMDPRHIAVSGFPAPSDEERAHPTMWRFWRALPPKGKIGVFFGAWHTQPILGRVDGTLSADDFAQRTGEILRFEQMLADEGVLLLKFWFHLSNAQQKARMDALQKDPKTRWRVSEEDWAHFRAYDSFVAVAEPFLRETSAAAPWRIVPGADENFRALTVGDEILAALRARLDAPPVRTAGAHQKAPRGAPNVLRKLDLGQSLGKKDYATALEKWQGRLNLLSRDPRFKQSAAVCVFEGNDAAGKGGAIRRVTGALDARYYQTVSIASPSEEERAQPYLWRFWRHVPKHGFVAIFDRSWYGRVLVERVEGFAPAADWQRAYGEINDFEATLVGHGLVVAKFWLSIDADEQLKRFRAREATPFKRFKITEEDWRNRDKWAAYETAVNDMIARTSTEAAPWTLVEANDKRFARIKVLKTLVGAIEARLDALS